MLFYFTGLGGKCFILIAMASWLHSALLAYSASKTTFLFLQLSYFYVPTNMLAVVQFDEGTFWAESRSMNKSLYNIYRCTLITTPNCFGETQMWIVLYREQKVSSFASLEEQKVLAPKHLSCHTVHADRCWHVFMAVCHEKIPHLSPCLVSWAYHKRILLLWPVIRIAAFKWKTGHSLTFLSCSEVPVL